MINDLLIASATSKILQRSERQEDYTKVVDSFVDTGIIEQIANDNNQIIYGRRGTGKTHLLRYLMQETLDKPNAVSIYIDCRSLGSSSQFTDSTRPMQTRCLSLFKDLLQLINQNLLEELINNVPDESMQNRGLDLLNELQNAVIEPKKELVEGDIKITDQEKIKRGIGIGLGANGIAAGASSQKSEKTITDTTYTVRREDKVFFPEIHVILKSLLDLLGRKAYIFIDEWASLPYDIQPYLAELLKRGLLPITSIVLKIASLEYRSNFYVHSNTRTIGMEIGSDITANIDVDDYYVFDKNPEEISDFFAEILYKHIKLDLPDGYLLSTYKIDDSRAFVDALFNSQDTFKELVRASEGVIRDLINIYTKAYFEAKKKQFDKIDKNIIINVAQQWYEQDKERNLTFELKIILTRIIKDVIADKKARSFLVSKQLENNAYLQQLFDLRVLHIVKRGYADKVNPGERYNIYTLDYGTYVDLLKTKNKPLEEYLIPEVRDEDDGNIIVPFDDKRTIRRIILKDDTLIVSGEI